ncbi:hypothetical protein [Pseudorhodoplanes sinuspersici]|uniref:Uncharacterized protein n=1 Tax=Pseudorhodoplanes sinuspersici TaxID=1235591 RepID=A0A1W6ZWX2_9HYPH|nr:hypothetical protein [Pseudorhodoplanes sinuspersici]ARQ01874.1 hypothetical protein CAK95_24340 [Pseudorhodoplanes sinuspersici]RKE73639.1 hypothetical protein DFP91_1533 [Pseudorhodoplanes sinuspersici]
MVTLIASVGAWFAARKVALILYGVIAVLAVGAVFGLIEHGKSIAEAKCDSAAKQAQIDALQADLDLAELRASAADRAIAGLLRQRVENDAAISTLQSEVAEAKLQSTAPGAKIDANAFVDDRCNYTDRGARRVRE